MATLKHDEIMLWLDSNVEEVVSSLFPNCWGEDDVATWKSLNSDSQMPDWKGVYVLEKTWEFAIVNADLSRSRKIEGHADMLVTVAIPVVAANYPGYSDSGLPQKPTEALVTSRNHRVFFEVKPVIDSLGDLFRQLRRYQEYAKGMWVVVSPDDTHASLIREQGFKFVPAPLGQPSLFS